MLAETRRVDQAAPLGVAQGALEVGRLDAGSQLMLVDATTLGTNRP